MEFAVNRIVLIVFYAIVDVLIIVGNIFTIVKIFKNRPFRTSSKYAVVLGLSLTELLVGICIVPGVLQALIQNGYPVCIKTLVSFTLGNLFYPAMSTVAVFFLNIDYILHNKWSYYKEKNALKLATGFMTMAWFMFWIVTITVLSTVGVDYIIHFSNIFCAIQLPHLISRVIMGVNFFAPAILILISMIFVIVLGIHENRRNPQDASKEFPLDIILSSALTLVLYLPGYILGMVTYTSLSSSLALFEIACSCLITLKSAIVPFLWLASKEYRQKATCCCRVQNRFEHLEQDRYPYKQQNEIAMPQIQSQDII